MRYNEGDATRLDLHKLFNSENFFYPSLFLPL